MRVVVQVQTETFKKMPTESSAWAPVGVSGEAVSMPGGAEAAVQMGRTDGCYGEMTLLETLTRQWH